VHKDSGVAVNSSVTLSGVSISFVPKTLKVGECYERPQRTGRCVNRQTEIIAWRWKCSKLEIGLAASLRYRAKYALEGLNGFRRQIFASGTREGPAFSFSELGSTIAPSGWLLSPEIAGSSAAFS
jgi:hypothetical protein